MKQCGMVLFAVLMCSLARAAAGDDQGNVSAQSTTSGGADLAKNDPRELLTFALEGLKRERLKLRSGTCRLEGSLKSERPKNPEKDLIGAVSAYLAFESDKLRYDVSRPGWVIDAATTQGAAGANADHVTAKTTKGVLEKRFSHDGFQLTVWSSDQGFAVISKPDDFPNWRSFSEYIDVRAPPLFDRPAIAKGLTLDDVVTEIRELFSKNDVRVVEIGDAQWEFSCLITDERWMNRCVLVIDTRNFTPKEYRCESVERLKANQRDGWVVAWRMSTDWEERNGVWVPSHYEYHSPSGPFSRATETFILDYHWEAVNSDVDDRMFTYETFDLPAQIGIQDVSGEKPVLVRAPIAPGTSTPMEAPPERHKGLHLMFAINAGALIVILLFICYRRYVRAASGGSSPREGAARP